MGLNENIRTLFWQFFWHTYNKNYYARLEVYMYILEMCMVIIIIIYHVQFIII